MEKLIYVFSHVLKSPELENHDFNRWSMRTVRKNVLENENMTLLIFSGISPDSKCGSRAPITPFAALMLF